MRRRKYGNRKVMLDGHSFDSKREARRYAELVLLQKAGLISELALQPAFELIPKQRRADGKAERACTYVADFSYLGEDGQLVVEDAKGVRTPDYVIKRKLLLKVHGITVVEV